MSEYSVFITIDKADADSIMRRYAEITPEASILFSLANEVNDSCLEDIQFNITINEDVIEWCKEMITEHHDTTGVFDHIVSTYNEKEGL